MRTHKNAGQSPSNFACTDKTLSFGTFQTAQLCDTIPLRSDKVAFDSKKLIVSDM